MKVTRIPGEDYLNLNVFSPALGASNLPVLVWIHGGGFLIGDSGSPWHDPDAFVADGVVLVTLNYRLGLEGLLPIPGLPANRSVHDWIAALTWVRECIAEFGGDPDNVTVGGQSAGSEAALTLLTTPAAAGLFRQVIAMSGALARPEDYTDLDRMRIAAARLLGVTADASGFASISAARLLEAQSALVSDLARMGRRPGESFVDALSRPIDYLRPTVDGELIPEFPLTALARGAGAQTPLLIGVTSEEINVGARLSARGLSGADLDRALGYLGLDEPGRARYRAAHPGRRPAHVLGQALTDRSFIGPASRLSRLRAATGARTFCYQFDWRSRRLFGLVGACHCIDLPFVFGSTRVARASLAGRRAPARLVAEVHGAFSDFVRTGDPGWPTYTTDHPAVRLFAPQSSVAPDRWEVPDALWGGM